eukprot:scaffold123976_cov41-Attheya_sp.AAC.1
MEADIDTWHSDYTPVNGIFVDEMSSHWYTGNENWENEYNHVVLNPGNPYNEEIISPYYGSSEVVVVITKTNFDHFQPMGRNGFNNSCHALLVPVEKLLGSILVSNCNLGVWGG